MRASTVKRALLYGLTAAFSLLSLYAYAIIPSSPSLLGQAEGVFLLNASLGALMGLLYSIMRKSEFFSRASGRAMNYDLRIPAAVVPASAAVALVYAHAISKSGLFIVPVPALILFSALALRGIYPFRGSGSVPLVGQLSEDGMVKFVTGRERLKRLAEYRAGRLSLLLSKSGEIGNPYILAAKSITGSIVASAVTIPVAVILCAFLWPPLIMIACAPALLYVYPEVRLRDKASQRREGVDRELPFFSILVNVLGGAGVPLYSIFNDIIETKIFTALRREALLIRRDVTVFGMNPNESFERLASYHPSRKFSSFLYGYTSKVRSGGDIPSYLVGESGSLLRELEEGWTRYAGRAGIIGSTMITVFGVIPLLLMVVGIFSPAESIVGLTGFAAVGVPIFTILLVLMAGRMQPVGEEPLVGNAGRSVLLSLPGLGLGLLTKEVWLAAASALFLFFTVYGFSVIEQRREMRDIEEALPEFMKDMMEFKRQEYDLTKSILVIAAHNRYTPAFDRIISRAVSELKTGTPIDELRVDPKSRLARMVFFILGQMSLSGGGSVDTFHQLSMYTTRVVEMKRNTQAEMRPYLVLSYISPILLVFGVTFVGGVLTSFSSELRPGLENLQLSNLQIGSVPPELFQVSNFLIVVSAAALGIIGAKMTDFTVRNTLRASVNVVIAVVATYAMSALNVASLFHIGV